MSRPTPPEPRPTRRPPEAPGPVVVNASGVVAFLVELAMLALLAIAGWRLGGSAVVSGVLAVVLVVLAAAVWGRWLAPRAGSRLDRTPRLATKAVLFGVVGVVVAVSGITWWGVGFAVIAWASLAWARD